MKRKKTKTMTFAICIVAIMLISGFLLVTASVQPATAAGKGTVVNDDITEDTLWNIEGSPYVLDGRVITIHHDDRSVNLTIDAGVEIQARSYAGDIWGINPTKHGGITVGKNGALKVLGRSEKPVRFTSASDEKNTGDWSSIVIAADSRASETVIQNAIIEYAGFSNAGISIYGGTPRISHTHFRFISANGIYTEGGATPTIEDCRFENNSGYAILLDDSLPHLANNSFANDQVIGFNTRLYGGHRQQPITHNGTLGVPGVQDNGRIAPYDLGNCLGIRIFNESFPVTLTITAGVVVQGHVTSHGWSEGIYHNQVNVSKNAALKVLGIADEPVVFTSAANPDDKNAGQWGGVVFEADSRASDSIIQHAVFEYGGSNRVSSISNPGWVPAMLSVYGGTPCISDSLFTKSNVSGLCLRESANPTITGCTFTENKIGLTFDMTSPLAISGNSVVKNIDYGAFNENGEAIIDMTNNWWGNVSGPLDDSDDRATGGWYNPEGRGDNVSDYIKYKPWLTSTPTSTPPTSALANCIYFNTGAWTNLSSVFTNGTEIYGGTNNKYNGTAYMYLWLSFDSAQANMSLRPCPDDIDPQAKTGDPNWGDRAELAIEEIPSNELRNRLTADFVPYELRAGLKSHYIYRIIVTAPDHGYHSSYICSFDTSPNYAIGWGNVDDSDWLGRVRVCNVGTQ